MAKRISRRELKQWNRDLKHKVKELEYDLEAVRLERNKLDHRLTLLGSKADAYDVRGAGIECIEINPETWGQYCVLYSDEDVNVETIKRRLAGCLIDGLMKSNSIQIIVQDDVFPNRKTIGAKLYVIPWDKMVKKLVIQK